MSSILTFNKFLPFLLQSISCLKKHFQHFLKLAFSKKNCAFFHLKFFTFNFYSWNFKHYKFIFVYVSDVSALNVRVVRKEYYRQIWCVELVIKYFTWNASLVLFVENNYQLVKSFIYWMRIDSFAKKTIWRVGIIKVYIFLYVNAWEKMHGLSLFKNIFLHSVKYELNDKCIVCKAIPINVTLIGTQCNRAQEHLNHTSHFQNYLNTV
jgi:hypothetical protein